MNHAGETFALISAALLLGGGAAVAQQQSSQAPAARMPCPCCQAMMQGRPMMQGGQMMGGQMMGGQMMMQGDRQAPRPAGPDREPRR